MYDRQEGGPRPMTEQVGQAVRIIATILGLVIIVIGLIYALRVFDLVYGSLKSPEGFGEVFARWVAAIGGEELNIEVEGEVIPLGPAFAIAIMGGGALILCWVAMGFITTGAKVIAWTVDERKAIQRLLKYAFGAHAAPPPPREETGGPPPDG